MKSRDLSNSRNPNDQLPLAPVIFDILYALIGKTSHGYEIRKALEAESGKAPPTATLYRKLKEMLDAGMIEDADRPADNDDPRRQYYCMTPYGRAVYAAEYNRLLKMVQRDSRLIGAGQPVLQNATGVLQ